MILLKTNYGDITIELFEKKAPKTVQNFLQYIENEHYNNTIFHRVIDNFMIQGGGYTTEFKEKKTLLPIKNEAQNKVKNTCYTLAMARTMDPHSATSQFFINISDNDFLNYQEETLQGWGYCVFGKVTKGQKVVDKIKAVPTTSKNGHENVPIEEVVIESIEHIK